MGQMRIIGTKGDTRLIWGTGDKESARAAENAFNELKKKGYVGYYVGAKGGKNGRMDEFDVDAEAFIMVPPVDGG